MSKEPTFRDLQQIEEVNRCATTLDIALARCCVSPETKASRQAIKANVQTVLAEMLKK